MVIKYYGTGVADAVDAADELNMAVVETTLAYARTVAVNADLYTSSTRDSIAALTLPLDPVVVTARNTIYSSNDVIHRIFKNS